VVFVDWRSFCTAPTEGCAAACCLAALCAAYLAGAVVAARDEPVPRLVKGAIGQRQNVRTQDLEEVEALVLVRLLCGGNGAAGRERQDDWPPLFTPMTEALPRVP